MTRDIWRYTCPQGHRSWTPRVAGHYYCQACEAQFDDLRDAATDSAPGQREVVQ